MSDVARRAPTSYLFDNNFDNPVRIPVKITRKTPTGYECQTFDDHNINLVFGDFDLEETMYYEVIILPGDDNSPNSPFNAVLATPLGASFDFLHYNELVKIMENDPTIF